MRIRVRLNHQQAAHLSLLDQGLFLLISAAQPPEVPAPGAALKEYTAELSPAAADRWHTLKSHYGLSNAALARAALLAAERSSLRSATLLGRHQANQVLRDGGSIMPTPEARAHDAGAEVFDAEGTHVGYVSASLYRALRAVGGKAA